MPYYGRGCISALIMVPIDVCPNSDVLTKQAQNLCIGAYKIVQNQDLKKGHLKDNVYKSQKNLYNVFIHSANRFSNR